MLALALLAPLGATVAEASETDTFIAEVNEARASHGIRAVRASRSLHRSSFAYANRMLEHQSFRHLASIRSPRRFGLRGEVLARSAEEFPSAELVVSRWLASPTHRAVLMNRRFRYVGVGLARGWLGDEPVTLIAGHFGGGLRGHADR